MSVPAAILMADADRRYPPARSSRQRLCGFPSRGEINFLRAVAEVVLQLLMEADVEGLGRGRPARVFPGAQNWRNGYCDRTLDTRLGALQPRVPKLRQGSYFPPAVVQVRQRRPTGSAAGPRAGLTSWPGDGPVWDRQEHRLQAVQGHR